MSRTSREKGKRVEREIAKSLGVSRNPADGNSHTDIYTPDYAIEVKARKALPAWIVGAMQQAVDDSRGRTPIVVLVQSRIGAAPLRYVMLRFEDFFKGTTNESHSENRDGDNFRVSSPDDADNRGDCPAAA